MTVQSKGLVFLVSLAMIIVLVAGCTQPQKKPLGNTNDAINAINSDQALMAKAMSSPETRNSMIQIMTSPEMKQAMIDMMKNPEMQRAMTDMMSSPEMREAMAQMMSDPAMQKAMKDMMNDPNLPTCLVLIAAYLIIIQYNRMILFP